MEIDELILLGTSTAKKCRKTNYIGQIYFDGEEYQNWLSLATRYLESNYTDDKDIVRFRELATSNDNSEDTFNKLISIIKSIKDYPPIPPKKDINELLMDIFKNFNRFDQSIMRRHGGRNTLEINDEYDVQDALRSILKLFVDDVRPEDFTPSNAGSNSRVDFLLPSYGIVIETKMTNRNLKDKEIGEQLIIDCARYRENSKYSHLYCFVYDKEFLISNPAGLINDLEKNSNEDLKINVIIAPQ